jgi:hypothetical protein
MGTVEAGYVEDEKQVEHEGHGDRDHFPRREDR